MAPGPTATSIVVERRRRGEGRVGRGRVDVAKVVIRCVEATPRVGAAKKPRRSRSIVPIWIHHGRPIGSRR